MEIVDEILNKVFCIGKASSADMIFKDMAKKLMGEYVIRRGDVTFRLIDIEFYYHNEGTCPEFPYRHEDKPTYKRRAKPGEFMAHYSGMDICFKSDGKTYYGGVLIRHMGRRDGDGSETLVAGPMDCCFALLGRPSAESIPVFEPSENHVEIADDDLGITTRVGINDLKPYHFYLKSENIESIKRYAPYLDDDSKHKYIKAWPSNS